VRFDPSTSSGTERRTGTVAEPVEASNPAREPRMGA